MPLLRQHDQIDRRYMRMACRLAEKAAGRTSPNPMVGAVLVRDGKIIGSGFHPFAGGDHAEIVALKKAGNKANGGTLYINLEPCNHYGRTPPCTGSLIAAGVKEVVVGMEDPNPLVSGKGLRALARAGIKVRTGVLHEECRVLNEAFTKLITRGVPFVTLKLAASLDGKIATATGDARWISCEESRATVHLLRNKYDAVVVGAGTIIADNPQLTCRISGGRDPWRIILDARLRIPLNAEFLRRRGNDKNIIVTSDTAPVGKIRALENLGATVWRLPARDGAVRWLPLLRKLAKIGIASVLIEGGATTAAGALKEKMVDKMLLFYAPKLLGGDGRYMIDSLGIEHIKQSVMLQNLKVQKSGADLLISGYLQTSPANRLR
ncbi:MAG TPA: bifunctional diaminohydroxyphosphoribosylaminopyrimidine deaminase/5-amino-6-(5-phosphoribosylamino)uracil reductase RibD [Candidatus Binatia bacterium]|nr:bifunctional diaminohydroxyphosphoribosylaminopyrimidine deaminase/5-amino-6-(5-phosphoribosylamino)uracil reductase RibD [Candidatus Binatia bacterium]